MQTYLKLFCLALPISVALNASWFGVIASGFYKAQFGQFWMPTFALWPTALFCVLFVLVMIFLVLQPALATRQLTTAVISGAALGFAVNMTYDLSNLATISGWPVYGSFVDTLWGTLMTSITCGLTYIIATKVFRM